jgi:hypothetical protein
VGALQSRFGVEFGYRCNPLPRCPNACAWLSPEQRAQLDALGYFDVIGSVGGKRYRIHFGVSANVREIGEDGAPMKGWCSLLKDLSLALAERRSAKGGMQPAPGLTLNRAHDRFRKENNLRTVRIRRWEIHSSLPGRVLRCEMHCCRKREKTPLSFFALKNRRKNRAEIRQW